MKTKIEGNYDVKNIKRNKKARMVLGVKEPSQPNNLSFR
jgi:hypothetical protein